jgi:membrane-bound serine protease (ClpP class)
MENLTIAVILILLGLAILAAEVFIPSFGILTALAIVCFFVAVVFAFNAPFPTGPITLAVLLVMLPLLFFFVFRIWPHTPMGKHLFLQAPQDEKSASAAEAVQFVGRFGRTLSPLRPSGITEFDGRRVDTLSEGTLIGAGQWVQCIDVQAGRVIVRPVDGPPDLEKMDTLDLG